ncbi:hypothetical protein vseg_018339 [Gypsophila vaccaria]
MSSAMQFWGVEVKPKVPCQVNLENASLIHISQVTLGDIKKDTETVTVHVKVGDKKLVMGMLSNKTPQLSFDLVFDEDFEISHNWKNGSVHLLGYQAEIDDDESIYSGSSDEEDEPVPILKEEAPKAVAGKPKVDNKAKPETEDESDEDDSSEDEDDDEDSEDDSEMMGLGDSDEDSDEDDSEESEDEKPAKADNGAKRPNVVSKTPQSKKAKIATPQKTDAKKGVVHPATPHPNKKGAQSPGGKKSPNSGGGKTPKSFGNNVSTGPSKNKFKPGSGSQKKGKHGGK